jgi:hypothetical protein
MIVDLFYINTLGPSKEPGSIYKYTRSAAVGLYLLKSRISFLQHFLSQYRRSYARVGKNDDDKAGDSWE